MFQKCLTNVLQYFKIGQVFVDEGHLEVILHFSQAQCDRGLRLLMFLASLFELVYDTPLFVCCHGSLGLYHSHVYHLSQLSSNGITVRSMLEVYMFMSCCVLSAHKQYFGNGVNMRVR